ncbi:hypothetical protein K435DRAFT_624395, partial [Dendrothele bispora CBS 962.96]
HAQARNVIERIFGVIKHRWRILVLPAQFNMSIQARIPAALAALHNFIMDNNADNFIPDFRADQDAMDPNPGAHVEADDIPFAHPQGNLAQGFVTEEEYQEALKRRDDIAQAIWEQYQ